MKLETWHVYRDVGGDLRGLFREHGWGGSWVGGAARERLARVPVPEQDPVGGEGVSHWR